MAVSRRSFIRGCVGALGVAALPFVPLPKPKPPWVYTFPFKGRIPDRMIFGDYVKVPLYPIRESVKWYVDFNKGRKGIYDRFQARVS